MSDVFASRMRARRQGRKWSPKQEGYAKRWASIEQHFTDSVRYMGGAEMLLARYVLHLRDEGIRPPKAIHSEMSHGSMRGTQIRFDWATKKGVIALQYDSTEGYIALWSQQSHDKQTWMLVEPGSLHMYGPNSNRERILDLLKVHL